MAKRYDKVRIDSQFRVRVMAVVLLIRWHVGDWRVLPGLWRIIWLLAAVAAGGAAYMASHWVFGLRLRHLREV